MANIRQQQNSCCIKSNYIVERYILDSQFVGNSTPTISKHSYVDVNGNIINNSLVSGVVGNQLEVEPEYRSIVIFFRSSSVSGSYMEIDGIVYHADIGATRSDPIISWSIVDENSIFLNEINIQVFDGAVVEVHIQREII